MANTFCESRFSRKLNILILIGTLAMTYLTIVKEMVLYQNSSNSIFFHIHQLAMQLYYPLLGLNLTVLLFLGSIYFRKKQRPTLLWLAYLVFAINVVLFSANNVLNWLEGQPLHRRHEGIGW